MIPKPPDDPLPHDQRRARRPRSDHPLRRCPEGRLIAGVAAGIASFVRTRPVYVRALLALLVPVTAGIVVLAYLFLWWLLPLEAQGF